MEKLADERLRVTRTYDVLQHIPQTPAGIAAAGAWLSWGTPDKDYVDCRLIDQTITGQEGEFRKPVQEPPQLVRVYEQIPADDEIIVGRPGINFDQYGNKTTVLEYLQFSAGTTVYVYKVGTTPAPAPNNDCILKFSESTNDGTLIRTKRTFINKGQLSDTETLRFGGKLVVREVTALNEDPEVPSGWVIVTRSTEFIEGLPVYRWGFVNAGGGGGGSGGEISRDVEYKISPDEGATGVTVTTIKYITDLTVDSNPIEGPAGSVLISSGYTDEDGYRMWTAVFASGQGEIVSSIEYKEGGNLVVYSKTTIGDPPSDPGPTIGGVVRLISAVTKNGTDAADGTVVYDYTWAEGKGTISTSSEIKSGGKLVLYKTTALGDAPSAPDPTIGGTVTLVSSSERQADGYVIYDYEWAEGKGEISRETEYLQSIDLGVTGITRVTIRALTELGGSDPTTNPGGFIKMSVGSVSQDGYLLWTTVWAKGTGTVSTTVETKNGGKLILYRKVALGAVPSAPSSTIGGTVTLIETNVRNSDGYVIYDYQWAEGEGEIGREVQYQQSVDEGGAGLTITTIRFLSSVSTSTNPITPPSSSITISEGSAMQDGYRIWTATYAKGTGNVSTKSDGRPDGSLVQVITNLGSTSAAPSTPSGYFLVGFDTELSNGHWINRGTFIKPPATKTFRKTVKGWQMPGLAYFDGTQLVLQPPTNLDKLASIEVSYSTTQDTSTPYTITSWASFFFTYTTTETATVPSQTVNGSQGLAGYIAAGGTTFGTNSDYNGVLCDSYSATKVASSPSSLPSGSILIDVDNDPYLVALDGTVVFRISKTSISV